MRTTVINNRTRQFNLNRYNKIKQANKISFIDKLTNAIFITTGVTFEQMKGKCRYRNIVVARKIFIYFCTKNEYSMNHTGIMLNKDRTTIILHFNMHEINLKTDPIYRDTFEKVSRLINNVSN